MSKFGKKSAIRALVIALCFLSSEQLALSQTAIDSFFASYPPEIQQWAKRKSTEPLGQLVNDFSQTDSRSNEKALLSVILHKRLEIENLDTLQTTIAAIPPYKWSQDAGFGLLYQEALSRQTSTGRNDPLKKASFKDILWFLVQDSHAGSANMITSRIVEDHALSVSQLQQTIKASSPFSKNLFLLKNKLAERLTNEQTVKPVKQSPTNPSKAATESSPKTVAEKGNFAVFETMMKRCGYTKMPATLNGFVAYQKDHDVLTMRSMNGNCCEGALILPSRNDATNTDYIGKHLAMVYPLLEATLSQSGKGGADSSDASAAAKRIYELLAEIMQNLSQANLTEFAFDNLNVRAECQPVSEKELKAGHGPVLSIKLWIP